MVGVRFKEVFSMANEKEVVKKQTALGSIRIADEVVGIIAGLAATEVEGVAGMSGGVVGGIAELLGRKNFAKGVKVEVGEKEAAVDKAVDDGIAAAEAAIAEANSKAEEAIAEASSMAADLR